MPIADDWSIDFVNKKVSHAQYLDEITASDSSIAEVGTVKCAPDVAGSLNNTYFILYSATNATKYHVWYNVNSGGTDPAPAGSTAIPVAIATSAADTAVATATQTAIDAVADFGAAVNADNITVTITNADKGSTTDVADSTIAPTATFVFNIEVSTVQCPLGSTFASSGASDYFVLYSANDTTKYHVWFQQGTSTDPAPEGSVGVQVTTTSGDSAATVATATKNAIDALGDFSAGVSSDTVTITNAAAGPSTNVADGVSSGCTFATITNPVKGVGKTVWSVNALYSYLQDQFDELGNMDDKVPIDAQTPTEYRFINNWFIDEVSIKYLKGGAIKTSGWTSYQIVQQVLPTSYVNVNSAAINSIATETTSGDTGTLLFADNTRKRWWIRPDDPATDLFNDAASGYTVSAGAGSGTSTAAALTGENTWANMFTLGTIETNTAIYVVQDSAKVSAWWPVGQIDVLLKVLEAGVTTGDSGTGNITNIFIGAREYSKLYDHFISSGITGGRNPVPLATAADLNNTTGQYTTTLTSNNITFAIGDRFIKSGDATKEGTVRAFTGTPASSIDYYLSGTSLTQFSTSDTIVKVGTTTPTSVIGTVSDKVADYGTTNAITFAFSPDGTPYSRNLNNGAGAVNYNCEIDLGTRTVAQMYEWVKFVTRRGATTTPQLETGTGTITSPGFANVNGEQYIKLLAGTLAVDDFTPVKASPFGTFAGGKFFGAQGVWIKNYATADAQNFQLIDSAGTTQVPPNTVSVTVSNLRQNDVTGVFVLTAAGGTIKKDKFLIKSGGQAASLNTIEVNPTPGIDAETPQAGVIRVVDLSDSLLAEQQYQYLSWDGTTNIFTLNRYPTAGNRTAAGSTGSSTILIDTAANFVTANIRKGDIVRNVTDAGSVATVVTVDSGTQITTTGLTGGTANTFANNDSYNITTETNRAYTDSPQDTVYAPIINALGVYYSSTATNFSVGTGADDDNPASMANTLIKGTGPAIPVLVRVRRGSAGVSSKILPFEIAQTVGQTGMSQAAIRTLDSIVT